MGLSCRISCRACPRPIWRVPWPQQLIWRCLAPPATIGSSRSTRPARCTGGSATCHGGAVQRSTNSRVRGARAALEASSSSHSTAAPRRSEESARIDLQTTTHRRRCALAPRRRCTEISVVTNCHAGRGRLGHPRGPHGCPKRHEQPWGCAVVEISVLLRRKTRVFGLSVGSTTYLGRV